MVGAVGAFRRCHLHQFHCYVLVPVYEDCDGAVAHFVDGKLKSTGKRIKLL